MEKVNPEARTDPLTGLLNRRAIEEDLSRLEVGDVVVLLDADHLGRVNEEDGRAAGDRTLRSLAACVAEFCRRQDWCGRLDDDELLLVVRGAGAQPSIAVERLRWRWRSLEPSTTFSAGVAVHGSGVGAWQTVARAGVALRRAKEQGRDRVEVYVKSSSATQ